jgi:YfiH family protein
LNQITGEPHGQLPGAAPYDPPESVERAGEFEVLAVNTWRRAVPSVVAGITLKPADFGLASGASTWATSERYQDLALSLGFESVVVARQVHGSEVAVSGGSSQPGFRIVGVADGHACDREGLLMTITVADCVPVFLLDVDSGAAALLHAGWRGAADGILDRGIAALEALRGTKTSDIQLHLGPAICGDCYEVGPEVLDRFGITAAGSGPLDLRDRLTEQALRRGIGQRAISRSTRCTSCDPRALHSHRGSGGEAGRMVAFLGRTRSLS